MSEAKGAEKRSAAAFSLSFSGAVRLGKYRKMMRELSASEERLYAEESDCAGVAKTTFPKIYDAAISAIKTIEREAYFSRHRELFAAADEILEGIYAEESISERTVRESLTARAPAEGYSYIGSRSNATQSQTGLNSTDHLSGYYMPLIGKGTSTGTASPTIKMEHASSVIEINVTNNTTGLICTLN